MVHHIKPHLRRIKTYLKLFPNSLIKLLPQHHDPKYKSKERIPRTTMSVHRVPLSLILLLFLANMVSCNEAGVKTGAAQVSVLYLETLLWFEDTLVFFCQIGHIFLWVFCGLNVCFLIWRQMGLWCLWLRQGRWKRWWWSWTRRGGSWGASRYVHYALAVVEPKGCACHLLVAMPSIATFPIGLLASVLSLQRPVIALDAISSSLSVSVSLSLSL